MTPQIKICGLQTLDEINIINHFPIDYVGFVFAPSKRQVSMEQVLYLKNSLRKDIKTVGVFVNEPMEIINSIITQCPLDIVQLHGEETEKECSKSFSSLWKSIPIQSSKSINHIQTYTSVDGFLIDTFSPESKGGTGKTFNWDLVKNLSNHHFIILAGGLNENNIALAIKTVRPHVVDVSSGVEKNNHKDKNMIDKFIRKVTKNEHK